MEENPKSLIGLQLGYDNEIDIYREIAKNRLKKEI